MRLDLEPEDARLLQTQLTRRLDELEVELVHTDDREMHRALRADMARLQALIARVKSSLDLDAASCCAMP